MAAAILFAALSALANAGSALLQRLANLQTRPPTPQPIWKTSWDLIRQPAWLAGAALLTGTFAFSALALYFGPLAVVQPVLVLELVFTLALRALLLHDPITTRTWTVALTLCAGLGAFLVFANPSQGNHTPTPSQWAWAITTRTGAAALLLLAARHGPPTRRATLFGAATGLIWSLDAAFVKQTVDLLAHHGLPNLLLHWPLYAMTATGVAGTILLQGAYRLGPLANSQASLLITDPLTSITLGIELFHEQLHTNPANLLGATLALTTLATGIITLSHWAPPTLTPDELHHLHPTPTPQTPD